MRIILAVVAGGIAGMAAHLYARNDELTLGVAGFICGLTLIALYGGTRVAMEIGREIGSALEDDEDADEEYESDLEDEHETVG